MTFDDITGDGRLWAVKYDEMQHTIMELQKMENVRNFLITEGVSDLDGMYDLNNS